LHLPKGGEEIKPMKYRILLFVLILTAIVQSCQTADSSGETGDSTVADHTAKDTAKIKDRGILENEIQTAMFLETATKTGLLEITLGNLAIDKTSNHELRNFGKLMVRDHTRINERLKVLAEEKRLKLPASMTSTQLEQVRQMAEMKTAYFEKLYLKMMIENHNRDVELFKGATSSPDTAISNFSRKYLPVLEIHREKALKVQEGL